MLPRPAVPAQIEDPGDTPPVCLVASATVHRFGIWLARATGVSLSGAPQQDVALGGGCTRAVDPRADLPIAGARYDAPVTFCDPWP